MAVSRFFIFVATIYLASCQHREPTVTVRYEKVGNLRKGDKVTLHGVVVGEVLGFHIVQNVILTDLAVQENIKLPIGSRFIIRQSLLDAASISIEPSSQTRFLALPDTVFGESYKEPVLDSAKQKKVQAAFHKMGEGLAELVQALSKDTIDSGK